MKRRLRHALIWVLIAAAAMAAVRGWLRSGRGHDNALGVPDSARARPAFVLDAERWTAFRIPSTAMKIKLLSRANLAGAIGDLVEQEFPYEIEYQLIALTGSKHTEGSFALTAKVTPMVDAEGKAQAAAFFRVSDLLPAAARVSTLELGSGDGLVLKLRARAYSGPIADVSVRTFLRQRIPERKLAYSWSRLSPESRARIGGSRIHALVDLTPEEQRSILQNRWAPFGPQGVAGRDYQERTLYLRDDLVAATRQLIEPLGIGEIRCGQDRRTIIGIPPDGGKLRLEFRRPTSDGAAAAAQVRFFGETIHERSTDEHRIGADLSEFSAVFAAGIVEIESPVDVAVRPYLTPEGQGEQLLEPDQTVVRTWRASADEPVTFPLGGDRGQNDFFRVSARPVADGGATLRYEFLDAAGAVVRAAQHEIRHLPSLYDVLLTPGGEVPMSDPVEMMFELPAGVAAVRFRAAAEILLGGYTRPASLPHRTRVPADYLRALPDPERIPTWFGLRPASADDLLRSSRSFLIHTQIRPPEDDADILAGKYQWEDFQPAAGALGQYLLGERDPESPSRDESLPSLFMPLAVGADQPLALANPPGLELPSRRLAYVRDGREPAPLRIFVDGAMLFERDLVTARGELLLPPIPAGSQALRIESGAAALQCFLNYVQPDKATKLKRLAQRFAPGDSLVFECEKVTGDDELLTGMFFAPLDAAQEAQVHVAIRPGEDGGFLPRAETFTPRDREYSIAPDPAAQTPVLGGKIPSVDAGRRFFIPLGSDLKAGTYQLTITLRAGSEGYLTLSKITGGDYSDARFFREASR